MADYNIVVEELASDGTVANRTQVASDTVAEGETDVYEVTVENPQMTASASQTSGN